MIIKKIKDDILEFIHYDKWSPVQKIASSFLLVIFTGAILLTLPISNKDGSWLNFLDALFTSTSAVCVTGLVTVVTVETYTLFGQIVIIALMQIGGLGLMTILAVVILMMKNRLTMTDKILMREMLNQDTLFNMHNYVKDIFKYTFTIEAIGIGLMALVFVPEQGLFPGLFSALFTSVSAFCNAGFDIVGSSSLVPYATNGIINFTVMGLIVSGGLGFSVWFDLRNRVNAIDRKEYAKETLWVQIREHARDFWKLLHQHTKIVLVSTAFLIASGTLIILLLEGNNPQTLGQYGPLNKTMVAMFQSVTLRTAGFATINIGFTHDATKLIMSVFMFIGGSPGGTAGGVKTTTMFMLLLFLYSQLKNRENLYIFKRSISKDILLRAVMIVLMNFILLTTGVFLLVITEDFAFIDILFEAASALGTVGLSAGITSSLTSAGKIIIIMLMYLGRIGVITLVLSIIRNRMNASMNKVVYPSENIIIG